MLITVRLNETEKKLFEAYAEVEGKSISELLKLSTKKEIENRLAMSESLIALDDYNKLPLSHSLEKVLEELSDV